MNRSKKGLALALVTLLILTVFAGCSTAAPATSGSGSAVSGSAPSASADAGSSAAAQPQGTKRTLKMGTTGATTGTVYKSGEAFCNKVAEVSGGMLEVDLIGAGSLGSTAQHYAQMKDGTLDFFITALDTGGTMINGEDFSISVVPYLFNDLDHFQKFLDSDILAEMMAGVEEPNNVKYLGPMGLGYPRALSTSKPVKTLADIANLKVRVPESPAMLAVWEAWGANPVIIASKDLYTSLESGLCDAQENDISTSFANGWLEVCKYFMELNYVQQSNIVYICQGTWDSLTEQEQAWITQAMTEAHKEFSDEHLGRYDAIKQEVIASGVEFVEVDKSEFMAKAEEAAREMDGDLWSAGLYDKIRALA